MTSHIVTKHLSYPEAEFIDPGIKSTPARHARLHELAGRYETLPEMTLFPSQGSMNSGTVLKSQVNTQKL